MDQITLAIREAERLRSTLPGLREDTTREGLIKYYETMLDVTERQHNMYSRLMLMSDEESRETAAEMEKIAIDYMGKNVDSPMSFFFSMMKKEIKIQLRELADGRRRVYDGPGFQPQAAINPAYCHGEELA